jgi:hypothetical protein
MIDNRIKALELAIATKPHRHDDVVPLATAFLEFIEGPCNSKPAHPASSDEEQYQGTYQR